MRSYALLLPVGLVFIVSSFKFKPIVSHETKDIDILDETLLLDNSSDIFGWTIDSTPEKSYVLYAESAEQINGTVLNLGSPEDFDPTPFLGVDGIWIFPYTDPFNDGESFVAFFEKKPSAQSWEYIKIRYYLRGEAMMQIHKTDYSCINITNTNPVVQWEEVILNLDAICAKPSVQDERDTRAAGVSSNQIRFYDSI